MSEQYTGYSPSYAELKRKAMQAFYFSDEDLPSNRAGKLSDKQKQRIATSTKVVSILFALSGLVLSTIFAWSLDEPIDPSVLVILVLITMAYSAIGIYVYWLGGKVYKSGFVKCVIGKATFKNQLGNRFLQVGNEYFRSQRTHRKIFLPDVQYKVYYAPSDNTIVSIEIVE